MRHTFIGRSAPRNESELARFIEFAEIVSTMTPEQVKEALRQVREMFPEAAAEMDKREAES